MKMEISIIYTFLNYMCKHVKKVYTVSFTCVINSVILKIYHNMKHKFPVLVVDVVQITVP